MKPRQGEDETEAPASEASAADPDQPNRTYEWLTPGSASARTLDGPVPAGVRAVPETQLLSEAIVRSLGREATAMLPDAVTPGPVPIPAAASAAPAAASAAPAAASAKSAPAVARTESFPLKMVSGLIEPRPPGGSATRIAPIALASGVGIGGTMRQPVPSGAGGGGTRIGPGEGPGPAPHGAGAPARPSAPAINSQAITPVPGATPSPFPSGSSSSFRAPGVGARLGQYEIIRELGAGGMGVVYLARDDRLGRRVAIKFLQTGNAELTRRFIVEARATARCSHENIVVIYEVGELQGSPFMVLEYLQGQTLSAVIRKSAPMPSTRAVELIASVIRALACAHEQGIVHRDLKPDNIFLTDGGTVKVLDFGIAKVLQDEQRDPESYRDQSRPEVIGPAALDMAARTGIIGTLAYMSPEQWGIGGPIDHRTDIWATGLILFQMLTGRHPLEPLGGDPRAWVTDLDSPMPSLRNEAPEIPPELADIVDRCLRKRKEERCPTPPRCCARSSRSCRGASRRARARSRAPYAGLRAFQEEDAGRFFGRSREIAALVTRIRDTPLMAVVGPSGVGKSSLVRAGVVPALKRRASSGRRWSCDPGATR